MVAKEHQMRNGNKTRKEIIILISVPLIGIAIFFVIIEVLLGMSV
jgi:hypothetical protein